MRNVFTVIFKFIARLVAIFLAVLTILQTSFYKKFLYRTNKVEISHKVDSRCQSQRGEPK